MLVICPKVDLDTSTTAGLLNCGWLNALKNSVRNVSVASSRKPPTLVALIKDISQLNWPGPKKDADPAIAVPGSIANHRSGAKCGLVEITRTTENTAAQPRFQATWSCDVCIPHSRSKFSPGGYRGPGTKAKDGSSSRVGDRQRRAVLNDSYTRHAPAIERLTQETLPATRGNIPIVANREPLRAIRGIGSVLLSGVIRIIAEQRPRGKVVG